MDAAPEDASPGDLPAGSSSDDLDAAPVADAADWPGAPSVAADSPADGSRADVPRAGWSLAADSYLARVAADYSSAADSGAPQDAADLPACGSSQVAADSLAAEYCWPEGDSRLAALVDDSHSGAPLDGCCWPVVDSHWELVFPRGDYYSPEADSHSALADCCCSLPAGCCSRAGYYYCSRERGNPPHAPSL